MKETMISMERQQKDLLQTMSTEVGSCSQSVLLPTSSLGMEEGCEVGQPICTACSAETVLCVAKAEMEKGRSEDVTILLNIYKASH